MAEEIQKEKIVIKDAEVKEEVKAPKTRQIIIETDGSNIRIVKAEVAGNIELIGVLQSLIDFINKK